MQGRDILVPRPELRNDKVPKTHPVREHMFFQTNALRGGVVLPKVYSIEKLYGGSKPRFPLRYFILGNGKCVIGGKTVPPGHSTRT
jgi:hypothetical protein